VIDPQVVGDQPPWAAAKPMPPIAQRALTSHSPFAANPIPAAAVITSQTAATATQKRIRATDNATVPVSLSPSAKVLDGTCLAAHPSAVYSRWR
jgi:hypothetical protein